MEIERRRKKNFEIVDLLGDVSGYRDGMDFKKEMDAILHEGTIFIAVDFEKARNISSDIINTIMSAHHAVRKVGGEVVLVGNEPKITETLDIVGIPMIMSVYVDETSFTDSRLQD